MGIVPAGTKTELRASVAWLMLFRLCGAIAFSPDESVQRITFQLSSLYGFYISPSPIFEVQKGEQDRTYQNSRIVGHLCSERDIS